MPAQKPGDAESAPGGAPGKAVEPATGRQHDVDPDPQRGTTTIPIGVPIDEGEWRRLKEDADKPTRKDDSGTSGKVQKQGGER